MSEEITVHADHEMKTSKLSIAFGLGGMIALLSAGSLYGSMTTRIGALQRDVEVLQRDISTRESKDAVGLMFGDVRARLTRIEALLDRPPYSR